MAEFHTTDRPATLKFIQDLRESSPFLTLGDNYIEQLKATLNYSPIINEIHHEVPITESIETYQGTYLRFFLESTQQRSINDVIDITFKPNEIIEFSHNSGDKGWWDNSSEPTFEPYAVVGLTSPPVWEVSEYRLRVQSNTLIEHPALIETDFVEETTREPLKLEKLNKKVILNFIKRTITEFSVPFLRYNGRFNNTYNNRVVGFYGSGQTYVPQYAKLARGIDLEDIASLTQEDVLNPKNPQYQPEPICLIIPKTGALNWTVGDKQSLIFNQENVYKFSNDFLANTPYVEHYISEPFVIHGENSVSE